MSKNLLPSAPSAGQKSVINNTVHTVILVTVVNNLYISSVSEFTRALTPPLDLRRQHV